MKTLRASIPALFLVLVLARCGTDPKDTLVTQPGADPDTDVAMTPAEESETQVQASETGRGAKPRKQRWASSTCTNPATGATATSKQRYSYETVPPTQTALRRVGCVGRITYGGTVANVTTYTTDDGCTCSATNNF